MKAIDKMPRKKKGGQSPARVPGGPREEQSSTEHRAAPGPALHRPPLQTPVKEDIVRNMREMFSHLDPEVIFIVLSECDFRVENAMDSLLELSGAATADPPHVSESGFERTAAHLLSPHHHAGPSSQMHTSTQRNCSSTSSINFMTEDLDVLVDQEVVSLNAKQNVDKQQTDNKNHSFSERVQSNFMTQCSGVSFEKLPSVSQRSGSASLLDELSAFDNNEMQSSAVDDLLSETSVDKTMPSAHLCASQLCNKDSNSNPVVVFSSSNSSKEQLDSSVLTNWNIQAPTFYPQQGPTFITPVASNWPREQSPPTPWQRPVGQAQLRPSCPQPPPQPHPQSRLRLEGRVLVLLRGPPGSGKSTLARNILMQNPGGVILSTDDYFIVNGRYQFDLAVLGEAHSWNHNRGR